MIDELDKRTQNVDKIVKEIYYVDCTIQKKQGNIPEQQQTTNSKQQTFDITWDFPLLIWLLVELYKQNIFNFKVANIIKRLIEPLKIENNLPKLQSNRLLLALTLTKLYQTLKTSYAKPHETPNTELIKTISNKLLFELKRKTIESELVPNNISIKNGTSGIAWIYRNLFDLLSNNKYQTEMEYWLNQSSLSKNETNNFSNFENTLKNKKTAFGILEGVIGSILIRL
ncbi:MAG: hypothetical protein HQ521_12940 [Bacteroidetes bacterium]|nr:hypothetical protein [Bacteroidota bacterium]